MLSEAKKGKKGLPNALKSPKVLSKAQKLKINDTIVIFDRIRENLKLHFRRGGNVVELVNRSIYQTLTRSLYTVFTCLFTTFALFFFGGETTKDFAFALIVGFMSGCYSSIFIAGPLWLELRKFGKKAHA